MNEGLNSDGIVGPFFGTHEDTIAQQGEGLVAYFHFRAMNETGVAYLLDEYTQAYLQDRFQYAALAINAGADMAQVKEQLKQSIEDGLPGLEKTVREMQKGIFFEFELTDIEILPAVKEMPPLAARRQYQGTHSHQEGMGPDSRPHAHDTRVNFEFVSTNGRPINFRTNPVAANFIDKQLKSFFETEYLNTSAEEIVQKLYELGEGFKNNPDAPGVLQSARLTAAEMTLNYKGDMDHPHVPMTFRVSSPQFAA